MSVLKCGFSIFFENNIRTHAITLKSLKHSYIPHTQSYEEPFSLDIIIKIFYKDLDKDWIRFYVCMCTRTLYVVRWCVIDLVLQQQLHQKWLNIWVSLTTNLKHTGYQHHVCPWTSSISHNIQKIRKIYFVFQSIYLHYIRT